MPDRSISQYDPERLEALEADLGPRLRQAAAEPPRPAFVTQLRLELAALAAAEPRRRLAVPRLLHHPGWTALAAMLVVGLVSSAVLVASRPQPVSADIVDQLQAEAIGTEAASDAGRCAPGPDAARTGGMVAYEMPSGPGKPPPPAAPPSGPTTMAGNPNDLSDRLAQALGISGDRVRAAMLATIQAAMPAPPPDPMAAIAAQLGVPAQQVCAAFFDGSAAGGSMAVSGQTSVGVKGGGEGNHPSVIIGVNGLMIDLDTATAEQLRGPAERLGVTPERLQAAVRAAVASLPAPPPPPSSDEIIRRFASNLGLSEDTVRAAIAKVEGTGRFYFAVPLPSFGH